MVLKLYIDDISPPVRSVLIAVKALELTIETVFVNLRKREHFEKWFLEINPQHSVPVLDDEGFIISDSHAIMTYLARRYGKTDLLYPQGFQERAIVDQRLHFDNGVMYTALRNITRALILLKQKRPSQYEIVETNTAYSYLEKFLEKTKWIAGDHVTLADFSLIATVTSADVLVPLDKEKYPKIHEWLRNAQKLPYFERNQAGLENFKDWIQACKSRCDT